MNKTIKSLLAIVLLACLMVTVIGCFSSGDNSTGSENGSDKAATEEKIKVAFVMSDTVENIYNRAMMLSLNRLKDSGYPFELNIIEKVTSDTAESVLRTYAEQGYDVILCHAGVTRDAAINVYQEYPETVFLGGGNDWETPAPNVGAYDQVLHEGCYLLGVIAGLMTESNVIGCVGGMPTANVTSEFNAFERGAKAVNPEVVVHISFIESWYDPVKAKESTNTQISMGADIVFGERDGVIQACQEAGIYAMAEKLDQSEIAPDTVVANAVIRWDNTLREVFDLVREDKFENRYYTQYEGAMTAGTCEITYNEDILPKEVKDRVEKIKADIISGELVVPFEP